MVIITIAKRYTQRNNVVEDNHNAKHKHENKQKLKNKQNKRLCMWFWASDMLNQFFR